MSTDCIDSFLLLYASSAQVNIKIKFSSPTQKHCVAVIQWEENAHVFTSMQYEQLKWKSKVQFSAVGVYVSK